ncbi:hypothetical protein [Microbulbifer pacificus]|uniref:Uncharacterized protein n=1 Tax=Microbulbifer pacificus TaxID=407164 RepID=A0AAU0MZI6_9GAMM|nr:hypothetical protein [Microbulbifer pacificus]WOX06128.1 hypothetical protein R5R33_03045 [Microbulbifer pacificus]
MKVKLKSFEQQIIRFLAQAHLSGEQRAKLSQCLDYAQYEYTGWGYYLTVADEIFPKEHAIIDTPWVCASAGSLETGYLLIFLDSEITLECFPYINSHDQCGFPEGFRGMDVSWWVQSEPDTSAI